jgi:hypothetical protein
MAGVTQTIGHTPAPAPVLTSAPAPFSARCSGTAAAVLSGALAAGLGLGVLVALAMVLWVCSPYPDSSVGGALHGAAALWLLAHGTELTRTSTLSGGPAPVDVAPLLLLALQLWLAHRAGYEAAGAQSGREDGVPGRASARGRRGADGLTAGAWGARDAGGGGEYGARLPAGAAWAGVLLGYLVVAAGVAGYADGGGLRPVWSSTARLVLLVMAAVAVGVGRARGTLHPRRPPRRTAVAERGDAVRGDAVRGGGRRVPRRRMRATALRAAGTGLLVLLAGGALVALVSLERHETLARTWFLRLAEDGPGRAAVLLLVLALVPNAAVWGASFALGPGFLLGTAHLVAPLGPAPVPLLPGSPVLALLPAHGYGAPASWVAVAVPLAAGLALAWRTVERAAPAYGERDEAWGWVRTVLVVLEAAALYGLAVAGVCAMAGGPLGVAALARFGPVWWQTGIAAAGWALAVGAPAAVVLRGVRVRTWARWW